MSFFRSLTAFNDTGSYIDFQDTSPRYVPITNLKNSDVFTAINVISNDIATNPIKLESDNVNHIKDKRFNQLNYLLNIKPNDFMTARDFKYALTANLLLTGNSYARILKDKVGNIVDLELLKPSQVTPFLDEDSGEIKYEIQPYGQTPFDLSANEILHIKFLSTNGYVGASPLYALADEMRMQKSGNDMLNAFFGSGINGSAILKMPGDLGPDARNALRNKWIEGNSGDSTHRLIILSGKEDYQPIEIDTNILKIINSNDYTTKQIAKAFGIPISRLGLENSHTSLPQSNLDYVQNSLDHYFSRFTSEFNVKLLSSKDSLKYHFEFDVSRLMELDTETNMKLTLDWFKAGLLSDTESRTRLGYAPADDEMAGVRTIMSNFVPIQNIRENFPNNVAVGNAYDDTGKPISTKENQKSGISNVLKGNEKDGSTESDTSSDDGEGKQND
ncbi:phage portal protein [Lactobacillus mulieris]|uniref:phage portal protein n=1 Tax=Lactobacillus mulieris TaxID=2508708 RepID=UPI000AEFF517|nr:phage portal protein [Lactobacillus mulieris]